MSRTSAWAGVDRIPVWVLRAWLVAAGMIGGVALAVGICAYWFWDFGPPVDLSVLNQSLQEATVQLDGRSAKTVAASDDLHLSDGAIGPHRLTLTPDEPEPVAIELNFEVGRWGSDLLIEIRGFDGKPLVR